MNIDWSSAPEEAQYFSMNSQLFYRQHGDEFQKFSETRQEWGVAGGEKRHYTELVERPSATPPAWTGEGLPPIGLVCERLWMSGGREYVKVRVVAHDDNQAVYRFIEGSRTGEVQADAQGVGDSIGSAVFRPIRTPEQIAEEARIAELNLMIAAIKDYPGGRHGVDHLTQLRIHEEVCIDLYDAGWRKQVAP